MNDFYCPECGFKMNDPFFMSTGMSMCPACGHITNLVNVDHGPHPLNFTEENFYGYGGGAHEESFV